ncbi:hypothetical protein Btru_036094 [Bulinus truncatus]|nr:hypothetical protein Btru_036094 [Bulinus truncatus]
MEQTQGSTFLSCPDGWSLVDVTCNKVYSKRLTWDGALDACRLQGAQLAKVKNAQTNQDIGLLAKSFSISDYWIGLKKNTISNSTSASEWTDGASWSLYQGFWSDDQPDLLSQGQCVSVSDRDGYFRWSLGACENKKPVICQFRACANDSFRCSNNICLSSRYACNGQEDCLDGLDETNCPTLCRYLYQSDTGTFISNGYPGLYNANTYCQWTIETSLGSVVEITFSDYDSEKDRDEIVVFGGGKSEASSLTLKHISGQGLNYTVRSVNNFMIIKFTSDGSNQRKGFSAQWRAVYAQALDSGEKLTAEDFIQYVTSFQYPYSYLPNQESIYKISARKPRELIQLKILDIDLAEGDYVIIYDGSDAAAPSLAQLTSSTTPGGYIFSTGSQLYLLYKTQQIAYQAKRGFNFSFETGCFITLEEDSGEISSPGYPISNYPNSLTCIWQVKTKSHKGITVTLVDEFQIDPTDDLQIILGFNDSLSNKSSIPITKPQKINEQSGNILIDFTTSSILSAKGFKATFSADCDKPTFNLNTLVQPPSYTYTYGSVLNISCVDGYVFDSEEFYGKETMTTITCTFGGQWNVQRIPNCTPQSCPALNLQVSNLTRNLTNKNGTEQGSIYTFQCQSGLHLIGVPIVVCKDDGTWSNQLPSCESQVCLVPYVAFATVKVNSSTVLYGSSVNVECIKGYIIKGTEGNTTRITCQSNMTFGLLPVCEVSTFNYCEPSPCTFNETCVKKIGGFECQCRDGFLKQGGFCQDIDECQQSTDNCSQGCSNSIGSYRCSCNPGYSLYLYNGSNGYFIPPGETGLRKGDIYFINHTCVLNECSVGNITNGYITSPKLIYHVNDTLVISCKLGYVPDNGANQATCSESGLWTPRLPSCRVAQCLPESLSSIQHPPIEVVPNGAVDYMTSVTVVCLKSGIFYENRTRTCVYDPSTLSYKFHGDRLDCGAPPVDCGPPEAYLSQGAVPYYVSSTLNGSSFRMECEFPFLLSNTNIFMEVICRDGVWDFQHVYCLYGFCPAPSTLLNGTTKVSGYEYDNITKYSCADGYSPSFSEAICNQNEFGGLLEWNLSNPFCIVFIKSHTGLSGNYCESAISSCNLTPCYNNGVCIHNDSYTCSCPNGTTGELCQILVNNCQPDSCSGHGTCIDTGGQICCLCTRGFNGPRCETPVESACKRLGCDKNGTRYCQPLDLIYAVCVCKPGYIGNNCSQLIDSCAGEPCQNGGTCEMMGRSYTCHCLTGFTGVNCSQPELNCGSCFNSTRCESDYNTGLPICTCLPGYTQGPVCQFHYTADQTLNGTSLLQPNTSYRGCHLLCLQQDVCVGFTYTQSTTPPPVISGDCRLLLNITGSSADQVSKTLSAQKVCQDISVINYFSNWITPRVSQIGFDVALVNLSSEFEEPFCNWTQPLMSECRSRSTGQSVSFPVSCSFNRVTCPANQGVNCSDVEMRLLCARSRVFANKSCYLKDICKELQPCKVGQCELTDSEGLHYRCICPEGYEGANCQHKVSPCLQLSTTNTTACSCPVGFTGDQCDTNIDDCVTAACNTAGTQSCVDGNNTFTCVCKPEYTGSLCQEYVDSCLSQPCLHGGNCTDLDRGYNCSCHMGWTGPQCGTLVNRCEVNPCQGGSNCTSLLNDFQCSCPSQTYGKTCETVPDVCNVSNPCLNRAQCANNGQNCVCTQGTTSAGCQLYRYNTCDSVTCLHGGTCFANTSTPPTCTCTKGFTGPFCETHVNNCDRANCSSPAVCIDGVSDYFCRCPVGQQGTSCLDVVSDDFDLCIRPSADVSGASLPYPVPYTDTGGFTVKLWVKFSRPGSQGYFFTLKYAGSLTAEVIFRLDHLGLELRNLTHAQYVGLSINDGKWHYIIVSWRKDTGQLDLAVDYQKNTAVSGYLQRTNFIGGGFLVVLGSTMDDALEFSGCISRLDMLNRSLDTSTELKAMEGRPDSYLGNVFRWGEVQPFGNTLLVKPSNVSRCFATGLSSSCIESNDTTPPVIDCPSDLSELTLETKAVVSWPLPNVANLSCTHWPGEYLPLGSNTVVCVSKDGSGNAAVCSFSIYVSAAICPALPPPRGNGTNMCDSTSNFTFCSVDCPAQGSAAAQPGPLYYTCGPEGTWESLRERDGLFPSCGKVNNESKVNTAMGLTYHLNETNCTAITAALVARTRETLAQLNSVWNGLCVTNNCLDVTVSVNCSQPENTTVQILLQNISSTVSNGSTVMKTGDALLVAVLDGDLFTFKDVLPALTTDKGEFTLDVNLVCPPGQVARNRLCVSCGPGTFFNSTSALCENCQLGQYVETYGQLSCTSCPPGKTTRGKGSDSRLHCTSNCSSGFEFNVSNNSCVPCSVGYYRDSSNSSLETCVMCPGDFITSSQASVSPSQCNIRNCTDLGKYRNPQSNQCESCPLGTYSEQKWQDACVTCPSGLTTQAAGSSSSNFCYTKCPAGQYYNISQSLCLICANGQYQDLEGQLTCKLCPTGQLSIGSKTSCTASCPVGQENVSASCQNCKTGYYKDTVGSTQCVSCPSGMTTKSNGSTSYTDCFSTSASPAGASSGNHIAVIIGCVVGFGALLLLLIPILIFLFRYKCRRTPQPANSTDAVSHGGSVATTTTTYSRLITRANLKAGPEDFNSSFDPAFYLSKPAADAGVETESTQSYLTWRNSYNL